MKISSSIVSKFVLCVVPTEKNYRKFLYFPNQWCGTWVDAVLSYNAHFNAINGVVNDFDAVEALAVGQCKDAFNNSKIKLIY